MFGVYRVVGRTLVALVSVGAVSALAAPPPIQLRNDIIAELRTPRAAGEKIVIRDIDLGGDGTDTLELEPMQVWAPDATIRVWGTNGNPTEMAVPKYENFKGHVVGNDGSMVYLSIRKGRLAGSIIVGSRKFMLGTAFPVGNRAPRYRDPSIDLSGERLPLLLAEVDDVDSIGDPAANWTCDADNEPMTVASLATARPQASGPIAQPEAGNVAGAAYTFRIAIDTDNELCTNFGNDATAITNYMNDLIAKSNIIYQRDLNATLVIGLIQIRNGGAGTDPWTALPAGGTAPALAEFSTLWSTDLTLENTQRSAATLLSGKIFNGGVAWINQLCHGNFFCGADGSNCGSAVYANSYAGPYSFVGSINVSTTNVDPTTTISGHQYAMPNDNNFWILAAFTHELGHNIASPHSWCVPSGGFSPAQKTLYGIGTTSLPDRNNVDTSASGGTYGGNACYSGSNTFPSEWGTIMSYSHNQFDAGKRASRYIIGKLGEASELMLPIFRTGFENATANGAITIGAAPLPCSAGQAASVANVAGLTYAWQITGGTMTSATNTSSITFTPNAANVTVTVTITNTGEDHGCSITTSATRTTACPGITAPTGVVATATTTTNVAITWNAVGTATNYKVLRSSNGSTYGQVGNPATNSFNDSTALASTAYLYKVLANDGSSDSVPSNIDLATTVIFTDPTLSAGTTAVKTMHVSELRTAVNAVRAMTSLIPAVFTDPTLSANTTTIKRLHIIELRSALDTARVALSLPAVSYTDPTITAGSTPIKAAHINDLRGGVQ